MASDTPTHSPLPPALQELHYIEQPDPVEASVSETHLKESDIAHINNTFEIAYKALTVARKTGEFCSIIKALQGSMALRRKVLGYDHSGAGAKAGRKKVNLLG